MATQWSILQRRFVDPYSPVDSDNVDLLGKAFSKKGEGRGVTSGMDVVLNDQTHLGISKGVVLKDYVVIEWLTAISLDIRETHASPGSNYVVMWYRYAKVNPPPTAYIDVIPVSDYNSAFYVILASVTVDSTGTRFLDVTYDDRDEDTTTKATEDTSILELCDTPPWDWGHGAEGHENSFLRFNDDASTMVFTTLDNHTLKINSSDVVYVPPGVVDAGTLNGHTEHDFIWTNGNNGPVSNISWNNKKIINLADPTNLNDAVNLKCLNSCINSSNDALDAERTARINCDNSLQTQIDNINNRPDPTYKFVDLTDGPQSYHNGYILGSTGNSVTWISPSSVGSNVSKFIDLTDGPQSYHNGYILGSTSSGVTWVDPSTIGGGGGSASKFIELTDGPQAYSNGDVLVSTTSSVGWSSPSTLAGSISLLDLCDTPSAYNDGWVLQSTATGVEWVDPSTFGGSPTSGVDHFCQLLDAPSSYSGMQDCLLVAQWDGSSGCLKYCGLSDLATNLLSFKDLCDTPSAFTNKDGCLIGVDENNDRLIFIDPTTAGSSGPTRLCELNDVDFDLGNPGGVVPANSLLCYDSSGVWTFGTVTTDISNSYFTELADTPNDYSGKDGYLVSVDEINNKLVFVDPTTAGSSGPTKFTELDDTPNAYSGKDGYAICVDETNNELVFTDLGSQFVHCTDYDFTLLDCFHIVHPYCNQTLIYNDSLFAFENDYMTFLKLSDTPASYSGKADYLVKVKPDESGLEFISCDDVKGSSVNELNDLCDVTAKSGSSCLANDGDVLTYCVDGGLCYWAPQAIDRTSGPIIICSTTAPSSIPEGTIYFII